MSRLWADKLPLRGAPLYVALAPESVAVGKTLSACDAHYGPRPWEGALKVLQEEIARLKAQRVNVTVVLSNAFVRYAIVPSDAAVSGPDEEIGLARFHFGRIHGERARSWELRLSEAPGGGARLAAAVDPGLAEAIRKCFPAAGRPRLRSVQPYHMTAFNAARRALARESAWLALVERGRACLALASADGWQAVQSVRIDAGEDLVTLLERESLRCAAPGVRRALVHGAPVKERNKDAGGWQLSPANLPLSFA